MLSTSVLQANVGEVVGLSCREANRARRKARQAIIRQRSKCLDDDEDGPDKKRAKLEVRASFDDSISYPVPDNTNAWPPDVSCLQFLCQNRTLTDNSW